ncbi:MAG: hypothetical protein GX224_04955 [Thermoplasmatales archaeon]|nr:hypothetical protein [Thermoplasmatales archaeon]
MPGKVYVVQVFTNGESGFPIDSVVEIGVASADLGSGIVLSEMHTKVRSDVWDWSDNQIAYYRGVHGGDIDSLQAQPHPDEVRERLIGLIGGGEVTSYDVSNAIGKFLIYEPWDITKIVEIRPSICVRGPPGLKPRDMASEPRAIARAHAAVAGAGPVDVGNALDYAVMAAEVAVAYRAKGLF